MTELKPLAGRFGFVRNLKGTSRATIWLARDSESEIDVVVSVLPEARAAKLRPLVGIGHPNVAKVLQIVDDPDDDQLPPNANRAGGCAVVAEYVQGRTMHQRLESGPIPPPRAVTWLLRVAQGLRRLHERDGVHGAISPRSIVVAREGVVPVLTQVAIPPNGAYCSPERVTGTGPSKADDVWALYATLYAALCQRPPFQGSNRKELARMILTGNPVALSAFSVKDDELQEMIHRGLARSLEKRVVELDEFVEQLRNWKRAHDDGAPDRSLTPPPMVSATEFPPSVDDEGIVESLRNPASLEARKPVSEFPIDTLIEQTLSESDPQVPALDIGAPDSLDRRDVMNALVHEDAPMSGAVSLRDGRPSQPLVEPGEQVNLETPASTNDFAELDDEKTIARSASENVVTSSKPGSLTFDSVPFSPDTLATLRATGDDDASTGDRPTLDSIEPNKAAEANGSSNPAKPAAAQESRGPAESQAASPTASSSGSKTLVIGGVVVLAAGIGLFAVTRGGGNSTETPQKSTTGNVAAPSSNATATTAATAATATSASSTAVAPTATLTKKVKPVADPNHCIAKHFPEGTFDGTEDLGFVCRENDPRVASRKMFRQIVRSGSGKVTGGMKEWALLSWYQLGVIAVTRHACCVEPTMKGPETSQQCESVTETLNRLGRTPTTDSADKYAAAVSCLFQKQAPRPFRYARRPDSGHRTTFKTFLDRMPGKH